MADDGPGGRPGADDRRATSAGTLRVLHVDPDERARRAVAALADDRSGVAVRSVATAEAAADRLPGAFDAVVAEVGDGAAVPGSGHGVPVLLYTDRDPATLDDRVFAAVDTVIQKRDLDESAEFLLDKVVAAVGDAPEGVSSGWRIEETEPVDAGLGVFVLAADGTVRRGRDLDELFPGVDVDAESEGDGESGDFAGGEAGGAVDLRATLSGLAADADRFDERATAAATAGDPVDGVRFEVPVTAAESRYYEYWSYPLAVGGPVDGAGDPADGAGGDRIAVVRDVTPRAWHRDQQTTYEMLVENARDGIYMLDETGTATYLNESFAAMLGYDREELLGTHASKSMAAGELERGQQEVQRLLESDERESSIMEMEFVTKDGDRLTGAVHFALLPLEDGTYSGLMGVVRDVTERKRRERRLRRQRERLDEFASVVAHDLRNPLSLLQGNLAQYRETGEAARLDEAEAAAERMERLIEDLLELARQGELVDETEPVELAAVARDCWRRVDADDAALALADPGTVEADRDRLVQLLENLFRNAVEHGFPSSRPEADDAVEHGSTSPDSEAREDAVEHADGGVAVEVGPLADGGFYVADDGPGIPEDERDEVFERGFTTREEGTGFGLAIVREVAEAHGWAVDATESESGGARFEIRTSPSR